MSVWHLILEGDIVCFLALVYGSIRPSSRITGLLRELARQQSSKCKIDVVDGFKLELRNLTHIPSICVIRLVMFINECVDNFSKVFKNS